MMNSRMDRTNGGFTLIEAMIVVAIVAILAAIVLPVYSEQIRKSRRTDAQRQMVEYAQVLERWFTTHGTYQNAANACGVAVPTENPFYSFEGDCAVAVCAKEGTCFTITATAKGAQLPDGDLTLDQAGARAPADKWRN